MKNNDPRQLTKVNNNSKEEIPINPLNAGGGNPLLCEHNLEPTGEEFLTQLDNVSRLTRFVMCKKCGLEALDVFVYIGTFEKGE